MRIQVTGITLTIFLVLTGVSTASEPVCSNGAAVPLGADGVWRIFKPMAVEEDLVVGRPRIYHQPWKKIIYRVPGETSVVEGFGPPSGGAKDHSTYFQDKDTLPLGAAETRACELFAEATFSVYSKEAVDRDFVAKAEVQERMTEMRAALEAVTGQLEKVTGELARTRRAAARLSERVEVLERSLEAETESARGTP